MPAQETCVCSGKHVPATFLCCAVNDCSPFTIRDAASGQVIQVHCGDGVSPVAEGAELWAGKGRILFLIQEWEHVLHKFTQPVI